MGYQWDITVLVSAIWLRIMRESLRWFYTLARLLVILPAILGTILPTIIQTGYSTVTTVTAPVISVYFVFVEVFAFLAWLYITLFLPIFPSVIRFWTGIDIAEVARATVRSLLYFFAAILAIGSVVAVFTWIPTQTDVQTTADRIVCIFVSFIQPVFDLWTSIVDFIEPLIPPINVFLALIKDYLSEIFDGLVTLLLRGLELITLFFTGQASFDCDLSFGLEFCNDDCVIRQLFCWFQDVLDFIIIDVLGGILGILFPADVKNLMLNIVLMFINSIGLAMDMGAAVLNGESGCLAAHDIGSTQGAFDTFLDRSRCVLNRNIGLFFFLNRALFGSVQTLITYFVELFDMIFTPFFGRPIASDIITFLDVIGTVLNIILNFATIVIDLILTTLEPILAPIKRVLGDISGFVSSLISCAICTLSSLPFELLGGSNPLGHTIQYLNAFANTLRDELSHAFNLIQHVTNLVSSFSSFGGGLFVFPQDSFEFGGGGDGAGNGSFIIPLHIPLDFIEFVADLNSVNMEIAKEHIMLAEIANGTMHLECGLSSFCTHMLTEERLEDQESVPSDMNNDDFMEQYVYWQCATRYMASRTLCEIQPNMTTDPKYHLATMNTWLPEDDVCKTTLEEDIFYQQLEFNREHPNALDDIDDTSTALRNMPAWWINTYIPCYMMYTASFPPTLHNETTGRYSRPEHFMTEELGEPGKMELIGSLIRMMLLGDLEAAEVLRTENNFAHRGLGFVRNVAIVTRSHTNAVTEDVAEEQRGQAIRILMSPPKRPHRNGKHSVYNYRNADGLLETSEMKLTQPWYGRKRMPDMARFEHKLANHKWKHTFRDAFAGMRNDSLHFHHELGFIKDKDIVNEYRERRGAAPGLANTLAMFMRWSMPERNTAHRSKREAMQPRWRVPSRRRHTLHKQATFAAPRKLHSSTVPPEGDFNLTEDILRPYLLDTFITIVVVSAQILAILFQQTIPFLADFLTTVGDFIGVFDFTNNAQFLDLVEDGQQYITNDIFLDAQEFLLCDSPPFYDVNTNPNGPWKWSCLLQGKLSPIWPRPPTNFGIIPWGTPCKGPIQSCDANFFNGDVTCPAGWEHCSGDPVFFEHGFDPLIYIIELIKTPIFDPIEILRGEFFGAIVRLGVGTIVLAGSPVFVFFGRGDLVIDAVSFNSLADVPFIGPIVFRYEGIFIESDFHNFCVLWWSAATFIPLLISATLAVALVLFLTKIARFIPILLSTAPDLIYLPTALVEDINLLLFKFAMKQTQYVHEQRQNIMSADGSNFMALVPDNVRKPTFPDSGVGIAAISNDPFAPLRGDADIFSRQAHTVSQRRQPQSNKFD
jgi:hypothetical protein